MDERRYDEDQFAEILRRAADMQARLPARIENGEPAHGGPATGMSLAEIRAIASEVGIDPELVTRAAALVAAQDSVGTSGKGAKWVLSSSTEGSLTDEDKLRVVRAIRDAAQSHGDADVAGAGLEWKSGSSDATRLLVTVEPLDGRNELRVSVDAEPVSVLTQLFPTFIGGLVGVGIGANLEPGLAAGVALVTGTAGTGFGVGRLLWLRARRGIVARSKKILAAAMSALPGGTTEG